MTGRKERRLVSVKRPVPSDRDERYSDLWAALAAEVTGGGAHAWHFVARDDRRLHLEFLEFEAGSDPREQPAVSTLLARLEAEVGPGDAEEWLEAR